VVVRDFDIVGIPIFPPKTNSPSVIDRNAILAFSISYQSMQSISQRHGKVKKARGGVQYQQPAAGRSLDVRGQLQ
jgi:hypothetical protein